ncbi:MAG: YncE family protein [Streptosporangiaceae bacterium]
MRGPRLAGLAALAALAVSACGAGPAPAGPAHPAVASTAAGLAASGARTAAPPGLPGCTTATTAAPRLAAARVLVRVGGDPFGVAVPPDGRFAFVSGAGPTVQVLRAGHGLVFTRARAVTVPGAQLAGETLTSGGRYLLAASDRGAVVIDVAAAEQGRPHAVLGTLAAPRGVGAIEVAVTHDSRLAFVSLEYSDEIAVFSLRRALAHGFGPADYIGAIPAGQAVVGLALSPDGRWLYGTSELARGAAPGPAGQGSLSVISVRAAATDPAHSVVATVAAGCQPVRVITSAGGAVVWVTARGSDTLLGFSAARLRSHPARSLIARAGVGEAPVGLALVDHGRQIVVADSDRFHAPGASTSLAVVRVRDALAGRPALAGFLPAGLFPREMTVAPGGGRLLVTCFGSGQLEVVDLTGLP